MDRLFPQRQWATALPDTWDETDDPAAFWIRFKGEVLVFHKRGGFVDIGDGRRLTEEHFRGVLCAKLGDGTHFKNAEDV